MRQLAAILLLGIFSFNLFGYRLVASFMEKRADAKMEKAIDGDAYNENELLSIKMPVNLPYYTNSPEFSRVDGEVEIAGTVYKYVKSRIYNDSLEMLCLPDAGRMKVQNARDEFSKLASDFVQLSHKKNKSNSNIPSCKNIFSEYEEVQQPGNTKRLNAFYSKTPVRNLYFVNSLFIQADERPPDAPLIIS